MKKLFLIVISMTMMMAFTACTMDATSITEEPQPSQPAAATQTPAEPPAEEAADAQEESPMELSVAEAPDAQFLAAVDERKAAILTDMTKVSFTGNAYYVSNSGNDENDGLSPTTAWATLEKVRSVQLEAGDAVFFARGDVFRGWLQCVQGVTYSAYGTGDKPILTESPENGAGADKWTLYDEGEKGEKIWVYHMDMSDCGSIVFNEGESWGFKYAPTWTGSEFVNSDMESFDAVTDLKRNLMFFSPGDDKLPRNELPLNMHDERLENSKGKLYLRCDEGNPGQVFKTIEFGAIRMAGTGTVMLASDCVVDNLCLLYGGNVGVMTAESQHATVQNCEIGWNGGINLGYDDNGVPCLVGDGFVMDGTDITIANNYIHNNWDNGVTIECGFGGHFTTISDITLIGNLISNNGAGIQITCFSDDMEAEGIIYSNFVVEDNYVTGSGDCWATEQHMYETLPYSICFGDTSLYTDGMYVRDNVFYASTLCHIWGATVEKYLPIFTGNEFYSKHGYDMVAVWNIEGFGEDNFIWYTSYDCEPFLNDTLGEDNTVIVINQ